MRLPLPPFLDLFAQMIYFHLFSNIIVATLDLLLWIWCKLTWCPKKIHFFKGFHVKIYFFSSTSFITCSCILLPLRFLLNILKINLKENNDSQNLIAYWNKSKLISLSLHLQTFNEPHGWCYLLISILINVYNIHVKICVQR